MRVAELCFVHDVGFDFAFYCSFQYFYDDVVAVSSFDLIIVTSTHLLKHSSETDLAKIINVDNVQCAYGDLTKKTLK